MKKLGFFALFIIFQACGPISINRSFLDEMENEGEQYLVPGQHFSRVSGDSEKSAYPERAMFERTPDKESVYPEMTERQRIAAELKGKLATLTPQQRNWFDEHEDLFQSDSQKVYFLSLADGERDEYLANITGKVIGQQARRAPSSIVKYSPRGGREVMLGMDKAQVVQLWGNPHQVDVAGNPRLENERWTFYEQGVKKYIYFARGKVEGWFLE
ncbi:hypothetical protein [Bacteriovorax sp. Seq25_V]|uniref:hypothetical protein n=1 Tax=Bacteriovorax sp. Seq25_V TaxID=1201288 RepID=UPI00038A4F19|nr:hypothetical protein [Bacteriovorax sp. Seq25_V]EQC47186.1 putative lipoprotein [Bacteriovorax sp. Seq25_V]